MEWQQPAEPRRGLGCGAVILLVLTAVVVSAMTGAVIGALVATSVTPRQAAPTTATPAPAAPIARVASVPVNDTNAAAIHAAQIVRPAVVTVINTMPRQRTLGFFGFSEQQPRSSGSGVIILADGYIVTNYHVIENHESLEVIYADGTTTPARLVGANVSFINALIRHRVDEQTTLTVWREGETLTLNVTLKAR